MSSEGLKSCSTCGRTNAMSSRDTHDRCIRCLGKNHEFQSCPSCKNLPRTVRLGMAMQWKVWQKTSVLYTQKKAYAYLESLRKGASTPARPVPTSTQSTPATATNPNVSLADNSFINRDLSCSINESMAAFIQEEVSATSSPQRPVFPLHHGIDTSQAGETEVLSSSFAIPTTTPVQRLASRIQLPHNAPPGDSQEASDSLAEEALSETKLIDDATVMIALDRGYKVLEEASEEQDPEQMAGLFTTKSQVVKSVLFPMTKEIKDFVLKSARGQEKVAKTVPSAFKSQFRLQEQDWALIAPTRVPDSVLQESARVEKHFVRGNSMPTLRNKDHQNVLDSLHSSRVFTSHGLRMVSVASTGISHAITHLKEVLGHNIPQQSKDKLQTAILSLGFAQTGLLRSAKTSVISLDSSVRKERDIWLEEASFNKLQRDREFLAEVPLPKVQQTPIPKAQLLSPDFLQKARESYKDRKVLGKLQPVTQPPPKRQRTENVPRRDSSFSNKRGGSQPRQQTSRGNRSSPNTSRSRQNDRRDSRQSRGGKASRGRGRNGKRF